MKQKASDIIKRAMHLADLTNTDFLTHWEQTQYINDAWKTVYQWLINKGDKQFVKEVSLGGANFGSITEYDIPDDLYQILSLKDGNSGRIIPRHTESESISSNTYEVVNGKIRLYGVTATNLVLTYYMTPVWITYPDKPIEVEVPKTSVYTTSPYGMVARYGNNVAIVADKIGDNSNFTYSIIIKNLITGSTVGNITISAGNNGNLENGHFLLGPNVFAAYDYTSYGYIYDWDGNKLDEFNGGDSYYQLRSNVSAAWYYNSGKPRIDIIEGFGWPYGYLYGDLNALTFRPKFYDSMPSRNETPLIWKSPYTGEYYAIVGHYNQTIQVYRLSDDELVYSIKPDYYIDAGAPSQDVDAVYGCLAGDVTDFAIHFAAYNSYDSRSTETKKDLVMVLDDSSDEFKASFYLGNSRPSLSKAVNYGFYVDGLNQEVKSDIIDTEFNFPNELYFSLIAADLAMRYLMKQNADSSGLQQLYQTMQTTFMNTLSQDGGYTRIKNIYRG